VDKIFSLVKPNVIFYYMNPSTLTSNSIIPQMTHAEVLNDVKRKLGISHDGGSKSRLINDLFDPLENKGDKVYDNHGNVTIYAGDSDNEKKILLYGPFDGHFGIDNPNHFQDIGRLTLDNIKDIIKRRLTAELHPNDNLYDIFRQNLIDTIKATLPVQFNLSMLSDNRPIYIPLSQIIVFKDYISPHIINREIKEAAYALATAGFIASMGGGAVTEGIPLLSLGLAAKFVGHPMHAIIKKLSLPFRPGIRPEHLDDDDHRLSHGESYPESDSESDGDDHRGSSRDRSRSRSRRESYQESDGDDHLRSSRDRSRSLSRRESYPESDSESDGDDHQSFDSWSEWSSGSDGYRHQANPSGSDGYRHHANEGGGRTKRKKRSSRKKHKRRKHKRRKHSRRYKYSSRKHSRRYKNSSKKSYKRRSSIKRSRRRSRRKR
jgi:hypothetical protein